MLNLRSILAQLVIPTAVLLLAPTTASAQETNCTPRDFNTVIDDTGEYLRTFSLKRRPILHEKFDQLAAKKKWSPETAIDQGYQFAQDKKTAKLDARARQLLIELDKIGDRSNTAATCTDLKRLKSVAFELKTVTEAKFSQMMARVNTELTTTKKVAAAKPEPTKQRTKPKPKPAKLSPWQTKTQSTPTPPRVVINALPPPEPLPVDTTFSVREIRKAGRGFFGSISAELASIMQYTFKNYGRPNGYILGTEGGGAFLAGLSFGKGRLTTKTHPQRKVFWQGPTVGYDLGLQGSRVMFLVYNLKRPEQIFKRYAGIGGSAYIVGGVGLTYHKRGKIVLAPIRTGLGLRLGANIGYLKFTPKFSINPF
jgi:hypothetical protein